MTVNAKISYKAFQSSLLERVQSYSQVPWKRKRKVYRDKIISPNIFLLLIILFIITKQQETNTQKKRKQHGNRQIHRNYYVTLKKE